MKYRLKPVVKEVKILVLAVEHKDEQDKYLRSLSLEKIKRLLEKNR